VWGKRVEEVVGVNMHCFEVIGRIGTHRGGCSTAMAVGRRGALVRGTTDGHWRSSERSERSPAFTGCLRRRR
jgi:hypothetical protein